MSNFFFAQPLFNMEVLEGIIMEVRNNLQRFNTVGVDKSKVTTMSPEMNRPVFKGAYKPKCYREARDLANSVYENSKGMQKMLMNLYLKSGENLNNIITAVGTACIAPIFITYNPFSKEDKDTKSYSAWRQPISAMITLGAQLPLMKAYNNWVDGHAANFGAEEMDLRAKPPKSTLTSRAKSLYKVYKDECRAKGEEPTKKSEWIRAKVTELQDNAFYDELRRLRGSLDITKIDEMKLVKTSQIEEAADQVFKKYLIENHGFKAEELNGIKKLNEMSSKGKKLLKAKGLKFKDIKDPVFKLAEKKALDDVLAVVADEAKVKFKTTQYFEEMLNEFETKKIELVETKGVEIKAAKERVNKAAEAAEKATNAVNNMLPGTADTADGKLLNLVEKEAKEAEALAKSELEKLNKNVSNNIQTELQKLKKSIYDQKIQKLEAELAGLAGEAKDELNYAIKKIKRAGSFEDIKTHGKSLEDVIKSVKIKKFLIAKINEAEVKLKSWKDRSGMLFGLAILPITCGILNWAYPRIMEHYFPHLVAAKKAKVQNMYQKTQPKPVNAKEAK